KACNRLPRAAGTPEPLEGASGRQSSREPPPDPRPRGGPESKEEISCTPWRRRVERGRGGSMKPTLVTGANGHVGNNLCRLLLARGERVRAMVRASADPAALAGLDVEVVHGDVRDAEATARAVAGCGRVYHTAAGFLMWSRDPE